MLEVLWPGPSLIVRYANDARRDVTVTEADYEGRPHFVIETNAIKYWLDRRSGGLSRLIDDRGTDWIAFGMKPWGDYPDAAASSFPRPCRI